MRLLGNKGERMAARYLRQRGYRVLDRNVKRAGCEIDIIVQEGKETVFVEVKTRRSETAGHPEDSVTPEKLRHIQKAALVWLEEQDLFDDPWRVDVIAIRLGGGEPEIIHLKGV